jgi:hypothetical protein
MSRALKEQIQPLIFMLNNIHLSLSLSFVRTGKLHCLLHIQLSCFREADEVLISVSNSDKTNYKFTHFTVYNHKLYSECSSV